MEYQVYFRETPKWVADLPFRAPRWIKMIVAASDEKLLNNTIYESESAAKSALKHIGGHPIVPIKNNNSHLLVVREKK